MLEQILPQGLLKEATLPTPGSWTSILQNCETIHVLFKPSSMWYSVMVAPGSKCSQCSTGEVIFILNLF